MAPLKHAFGYGYNYGSKIISWLSR